ncbi:MAG: hypothetical protein HXS54_18415 [Theionarchaea archaeon]|nr:hypothetical protein [Theionarchaea archaeon]
MEPRINIEKAGKMALFELLKIREEIDSLFETFEILKDEETLKSIRKGMKNIEEGDFISLEELIEKYGLQNEMNLFFQKDLIG